MNENYGFTNYCNEGSLQVRNQPRSSHWTHTVEDILNYFATFVLMPGNG